MKSFFLKTALAMASVLLTEGAIAQAQKLSYVHASELGRVGQILPTSNQFHRIDTATYPKLPAVVKTLLTQSAGKAFVFKTNSKTIAAKWCVSTRKQSNNLTPINQKGLDLYIKRQGEWIWAGVGRPDKNCNEQTIVADMDGSEKECLLYLPLYDETISLEVGVENGSKIAAGASPFNKRILIYGSSIAQGASASRPGLAYPALLSRRTGLDFLNLGLSGNAKMHREVVDMIIDIPADAYILDCVPNSSPAEIKERTAYLVNSIRKKYPKTPIIMIQSLVREQGNWNNTTKERVAAQNQSFQVEFDALISKGVKDLYFIKETNFLGTDHEGTVDGTHPNDVGFERFVNVIEPQIINILKKYKLAEGSK